MFVTHDDRFDDVLGEAPTLVKVVDTDAHEGPLYDAREDALYFTTVPRRGPGGVPHVSSRRLELDGPRLTTVRTEANVANGMFLDRDRSLVVLDTEGRIYASALNGIHVFDPTGDFLGEISLLGAVYFTFGGPDRNVLFFTADTAIWAVVLNAEGASPWHSSEPGVSSTTQARRPSPRRPQPTPTLVEAASSSPW